MRYPIFPKPAKYSIGRQVLTRKGRKFIHLSDAHSENLLAAVVRFADQHQLELSYGAVAPTECLISLRLSRGFGAEGHEIHTSEAGYQIRASEECGLFRGLASVSQLLQYETWPYVSISDAPEFKHRGVMLDISRCKVPTLSTLKQLIDQFAQAKFNQLQLYTEHTFAFQSHQTVWAEASPLTAADILELKHFAAARYIELVPNLNCFGHFERWLCHPEYHRYAECPDGFIHPLSGVAMASGSTLYPSKQSLKLVDELHAEYLPLFDSEYFNIGGDEPWELGLGRSQARCEQSSTTSVYLDFISDIQRLTEKRGRQMMFWSDIVLKDPASLKRLSKELIALNWGYEGNHPFAAESELVAKQKIPFYVCPGTSSWNSLIGRTENMRRNIQSAAKQGLAHGSEGLLVTDWGDHGHHQYLPISYPGFAMAACESWHQGSVKLADLSQATNRLFVGEPDTSTADTLIALGKVLDLAKSPIRNATIFNRLLFWRMGHEPGATKKITDRELFACLDALSEISERSPAKQPIVAAEIANAIAMAEHGVNRLLYFRQVKGFKGKPALSRLREDMKTLKGQHESLWLERNRTGGLRESIGHLERAEQGLFPGN